MTAVAAVSLPVEPASANGDGDDAGGV